MPASVINTSRLEACLSCGVTIRADVFPNLIRKRPAVQTGELLQTDNEASCFYHPRKKAAVPCSVCGRFLCSLCEVELDGRSMCLTCVESGKNKRKIKSLENKRTLYDTKALSVAIVPMIFVYPTIITAPIALFMSLWYWKKSSSIIPRTKIRFIIAIILSLSQITGWLFVLWFFIR
ncbi:hypothetical protein QUF90_07735 [Desulfococcaceae bacterium HSG9]|nr:hypothetical protein [Desulfococcaceae bacterium HSG9]